MKEEPCEDIEQSYFEGFKESNFQRRTVESLEAESTRFGDGNATARTLRLAVLAITDYRSPKRALIHHLHAPPGKRKAYIHSFSFRSSIIFILSSKISTAWEDFTCILPTVKDMLRNNSLFYAVCFMMRKNEAEKKKRNVEIPLRD